ncbi:MULTISPECIES: hypothetical protein [Mycolicibacterium]|uniref:Uncharacterized protein n=2 Tax=Mycolicibacterium fortuitum TaxID=1766 RepID=A0AAE4VFN2_MYCFO|nr:MULTISPECIES: hypothetical protein [Mycolicibacterium]MBU8814054.1 hypothetical protein [Mycolicibacterium goodii]MCV7137870.1 hypothetical protein [Mycolicibacterium fortuitum]MDV7193341.1 hypothetical protein [Mycolicibacterium fortuitum]MDV7205978.1 hypothetical protein [Mycolicibacterium fortuitum]MDV7227391.1 hypothetical protein [Mycolicibacterium fortuitum]
MLVYTPIRRVERKVGRGIKGNRLLLGPYKLKRELPILLGGTAIAASLALTEFPIIGSMLNTGATIGKLLAAALMMLLAFVAVLGSFVWVARLRGAPDWPPQHVRHRARLNQWFSKPVRVSGHDQESPPSVVAGGKVRVR